MKRSYIDLTLDNAQGLQRIDDRVIAAQALHTVALRLRNTPTAYSGLELFAEFTDGADTYTVPFDGLECVVPWEVLQASSFSFAIFGEASDGEMIERLTTERITVYVSASIDGTLDAEPTPSIFDRFLQTVEEIYADIEAGKIKGEKGDPSIMRVSRVTDGVLVEVFNADGSESSATILDGAVDYEAIQDYIDAQFDAYVEREY